MVFAIPRPEPRAGFKKRLRCGLECKLWEREMMLMWSFPNPSQSRPVPRQDYPTALAANFFLARRIFYLLDLIAIATAHLRFHSRSSNTTAKYVSPTIAAKFMSMFEDGAGI